MEEIEPQLLRIGGSQMDLYHGLLSPDRISDEIIEYLQQNCLLEKNVYLEWLNQNDGFRLLTLSDGSIWVLREGKEKDKYVHVHPGRYSPQTLRVKASVLKTAIAVKIHVRDHPDITVNTELLNKIRKLIKLSPLKGLQESKHLTDVLALLSGRESFNELK
ncbi:hypothetical protein KK060_12530 [Fulvivirgaceae bacterium PWU20]|uniref:Uncharacterized protein n=2 Tax=Chryseosolibacter indicus TaxID=2782351 RepID=A0ABS5VSD9_9BACT|nr:hypothetical protein [Chryseosolibacter indicus]